jgi:hypothetical protein
VLNLTFHLTRELLHASTLQGRSRQNGIVVNKIKGKITLGIFPHGYHSEFKSEHDKVI